jgi:HEPN domain-containing protein
MPPEAHIFLRDARHAKNVGHHRRSVLDSATAVELSLTKLRDKALKSATVQLAEYVGKNVAHIERLAIFLRAMGKVLPDNITEEIAQPRNKAIHEGHELDEETAAKALVKAEEVVDLAFPWKKLL